MKMPKNENWMESISNLLTNMALKNAPIDDIAKVVRHSMTIIDSEKENNIEQFRSKYTN